VPMAEGMRENRSQIRRVSRQRLSGALDLRLQMYGAALGVRLLARRRLKRGLRYVIVPVNYWRGLEYRLALDACGFWAGHRVLDVGSPKLLSLWLADRVGAEVVATDIETYFIEEYELLRQMRGVPAERLRLCVEDGRRLSFGEASFDRVYSLSVLEHIPDDGDSVAVRELARVLAPGGVCAITVPFWPASRTDWREPDFYWAAPEGSRRVFYQRRYSAADLYERLIDPSGLRLVRLAFVGDRVDAGRGRELCEFLPPLTGPIQPALSRLLMTSVTEDWQSLRKPLCALVVLEKPAAAM
jgi:SAM-dependent methyltransferase